MDSTIWLTKEHVKGACRLCSISDYRTFVRSLGPAKATDPKAVGSKFNVVLGSEKAVRLMPQMVVSILCVGRRSRDS